MQEFMAEGVLLPFEEVDPEPFAELGAVHVLRHPQLAMVTYPYEWSFGMLKDAALLHLDLHLAALERGVTLSDGSAYNIQFETGRPVFIDCTSLVPYEEGAFWNGHGQFCDQFLNPLLLMSHGSIPFQRWYRGAPEGISAEWLSRILPWRSYSALTILLNVLLRDQLMGARRDGHKSEHAGQRPLPLSGLRWMLRSMRSAIAKLRPPSASRSAQSGYGFAPPHTLEYQQSKHNAVEQFMREVRPVSLLDLGCNTGVYARHSMRAGAGKVIGIDSDPWSVDQAYRLARRDNLDFLPLVVDLVDPSPAQGWNGKERRSFAERVSADASIALAVTHHMCIGRNIPLPQVVDWVAGTARQGLIEFVPLGDPLALAMAGARVDNFSDYDRDHFERELRKRARICKVQVMAGSARTLYQFSRD